MATADRRSLPDEHPVELDPEIALGVTPVAARLETGISKGTFTQEAKDAIDGLDQSIASNYDLVRTAMLATSLVKPTATSRSAG